MFQFTIRTWIPWSRWINDSRLLSVKYFPRKVLVVLLRLCWPLNQSKRTNIGDLPDIFTRKMKEKCVTKENNSYGPKLPSTVTFLIACPLRMVLFINIRPLRNTWLEKTNPSSGVDGQLICVWNKSIFAWSFGRSPKLVSLFRLA